ncbi:MAG: hypothetical protein KME21_03985 [Desmonostoc vinosum HA7617-LM4]|jgi:hypothetical protein|nr:hypothetical protein [Desmonostoc vinosum HA7617-LM4]
MTETSLGTILIVTDDVSQISGVDGAKTGGALGESWADNFGRTEASGSKGLGLTVAVSTIALETRMKEFIATIGKIFRNAEQQALQENGMYLDEVELSVEVSAKGEIKLIGTAGISGENKGAIKFKFKRKI